MNRLSYNVKLYVKIVNNIDHMVLQEALSALAALAAWADEWQLSVSIDKCGVLCVGKGVCSAPQQFKLHDSFLPIVSSYRDLGITITSDLAPSTHINNIAKKSHQRANMIIRCFVSRNTDLLVRALTTYVRPLLEYNSVVWSHYLKRDIELIENVQRRFTKRLKGLSALSYDDRLKLLTWNG